ncbi:MAG: tRNA lysidine(34) synthetase TilS [Victivallales bacterium]|nr:tRNA lysidine(34) synthetase TilS [Victivallales bacterium]
MNPCEAIRAFQAEPDWAYVGFSGGADSTALLLAMVQCGWKVTAVHFNHHLRGAESDADELWCRKFCEERHVRLKVFDLWVEQERQPGEGVEECARRLRLEVWKRLVKDECRPIFLAHHADDCLEELFLRLGRGSNASGLTSLRPERELNGLTLCRPFLQLRKRDLEEWLRGQGIDDWRIDHTNLEASSSRRNAIRSRLLPLVREIFGTDAGFLAALQSLREDADCLEKYSKKLWKDDWEKHRNDWEWDDDTSPLRFWRELPSAVFVRLFRSWAGLDYPLSHLTMDRLKGAIKSGKEEMVPLWKGRMADIKKRDLQLLDTSKKPEYYSFYEDWHWVNEFVGRYRWLNCIQEEMPVKETPGKSEFNKDDAFGSALEEGHAWSSARDKENMRFVSDAEYVFSAGDIYYRLEDDPPFQAEDYFCEEMWSQAFDVECLSRVLTIMTYDHGEHFKIQPLGLHGHHRNITDIFKDKGISVPERNGWPMVYAGNQLIWIPGVCRTEFGKVTEQTREMVFLTCEVHEIGD